MRTAGVLIRGAQAIRGSGVIRVYRGVRGSGVIGVYRGYQGISGWSKKVSPVLGDRILSCTGIGALGYKDVTKQACNL